MNVIMLKEIIHMPKSCKNFIFYNVINTIKVNKIIKDMENNKVPYICGLTASPLTDSIDYTKNFDMLYN